MRAACLIVSGVRHTAELQLRKYSCPSALQFVEFFGFGCAQGHLFSFILPSRIMGSYTRVCSPFGLRIV